MKSALKLIFLLFIFSCSGKTIEKDKFPMIDSKVDIKKVREFEAGLQSIEITIETRIYSSGTKPPDGRSFSEDLCASQLRPLS